MEAQKETGSGKQKEGQARRIGFEIQFSAKKLGGYEVNS
jgi:hypothetical protein